MHNLEDVFIEKMINDSLSVTVFLTCGVKLQGIIVNHNAETLLLRRDNHLQLVYKHAVSTIMPSVIVVL